MPRVHSLEPDKDGLPVVGVCVLRGGGPQAVSGSRRTRAASRRGGAARRGAPAAAALQSAPRAPRAQRSTFDAAWHRSHRALAAAPT
eukprot:scaffold31581_cov19-Tisochrysis_lutea.AAC.2